MLYDLWNLLSKHHGLDWLAIILTFVSLWRLGARKRDGFLYGAGATIAWAAFNVGVASVAGVLANLIFAAMNARGFAKWKAEKEPPVKPIVPE